MKYGEMTFGQMEALINKLGGMDGVRRILSGELTLSGKEKEVVAKFDVWRTIKLGTGPKTAEDFRRALKKAGCAIGDYANDILGKPAFKLAAKETDVDLVIVSVAELGFKDGATRRDIYREAQKLGLELCPPEVGPQLRLQYLDQSLGEWLLIGMEPITDSDGDPDVFYVGRLDGARWLDGSGGGFAGRFWGGGGRWVFRVRK